VNANVCTECGVVRIPVTTPTIVDLFAGPGGWDIAARDLGLDPIGIELSASACATRAANGLATIRASVADYPPERFGHITGLIASPPCPLFSSAGSGAGRALIAEICAAVTDALAGQPLAPHRAILEAMTSPTIALEASLTAEPARWIAATRPEWIAMEQVPAVLPIWRHYAHLLRAAGYSAWAGILSAEQYGAPQTRRRAVLIASRTRTVTRPEPTHQRFEPGTAAGAADECHPSLFSPGLLPWVSMADALATTEPFSTRTLRGAGMVERSGGRRPRGHDEPPTITASLDNGNKRWTVNTHTDQRPDGTTQERPLDAPAPTLTGKSGGQWTMAREDDAPTIRLTTEQAAALQTFPPTHRFVGNKTAVFQQIGNAVPPIVSAAILRTVAA
jgi:DNA (cytosine-5)-methyltransferase 1